MTGKTSFILIEFVFFIIIEAVMMRAFQSSGSAKKNKILGVLCRLVLAVCIISYFLLAGLFLYVGIDLLLIGEMSEGIRVLLSAVIVAVCVYIWLVRGWIKHMKEMKNKSIPC